MNIRDTHSSLLGSSEEDLERERERAHVMPKKTRGVGKRKKAAHHVDQKSTSHLSRFYSDFFGWGGVALVSFKKHCCVW